MSARTGILTNAADCLNSLPKEPPTWKTLSPTRVEYVNLDTFKTIAEEKAEEDAKKEDAKKGDAKKEEAKKQAKLDKIEYVSCPSFKKKRGSSSLLYYDTMGVFDKKNARDQNEEIQGASFLFSNKRQKVLHYSFYPFTESNDGKIFTEKQ